MQISHTEAAESARPRRDSVRVGDHVRVRHERWVVTEIRPHEDCSALTLSGLGPATSAIEQQILTPFDLRGTADIASKLPDRLCDPLAPRLSSTDC